MTALHAAAHALERVQTRAATYGWPTYEDLIAKKAERDERDLRR